MTQGEKVREETGEVVATDGNVARVRVERGSGCTSCAHEHSCGMYGKGEMVLVATNRVGAKPGEKVRVALTTIGQIKASCILYLVPLVGLLIGVFVGYKLAVFGEQEMSAALFSLVFVMLSFLGLRVYGHARYDRYDKYKPEITAVVR